MAEQDEILIKPGMGALHYWKDIWRYRELFFFLAWRDILVRYKQIVIGIAWSSTVLTVLIFIGGLIYFRNMERSFADVI